MIEIQRAPAFATVQDGGRNGFRSNGVPPGGAMDLLSLRVGNALLGNEPDTAAIEWALTGGALRFRSDVGFVLAGAEVAATLDGVPVPRNAVTTARAGQELIVERIVRGRFAYFCVAGGIDVPPVLGGYGTYAPAGFGGLDGRALRDGDGLAVGHRPGVTPAAVFPESLDVLSHGNPLTIVRGPQSDVLAAGQWREVTSARFTVHAHSDRTGIRLTGGGIAAAPAADGRSEPACVGALQLTPDGTLIALMPDGPTVGGYPKVAVLSTAGRPWLAQKSPGDIVTLRLIDRSESIEALLSQQRALATISALTRAGGSA